ncbi:uncharacterized protein [Branchiostoma lanceolatum]|uniref:uncharacterized protein n=1 Tax=Branchiostoma lanceolatum TaxID=7740 RepID=UPI0034513EB4
MSKNGLTNQPHRIYNLDETGFDLDPHKKKVVTFTRMSAPAASVRKAQINERWLKLNEVSSTKGDGEEEDADLEQDEENYDLLPVEEEVLEMAKGVAEAEEQEEDNSRVLLDIEEEALQMAEEAARRSLCGKRKEKVPSSSTQTPCYACGGNIGQKPIENPFVKAGIVPPYVVDILQPIQESKQRKILKPKALVFDRKYHDEIRRKEEEKEKQKHEEQIRKKEEREEKKRKRCKR